MHPCSYLFVLDKLLLFRRQDKMLKTKTAIARGFIVKKLKT